MAKITGQVREHRYRFQDTNGVRWSQTACHDTELPECPAPDECPQKVLLWLQILNVFIKLHHSQP